MREGEEEETEEMFEEVVSRENLTLYVYVASIRFRCKLVQFVYYSK